MKIAYINSVAHYGSTGRIVDDLATIAVAKSHSCIKIFGRGKREGPDDYKNQTDFGFYLSVLATRLFDLHGLFSIIPTVRIIRSIKKYKPDIIHLHNIHGYYANYYILFKYLFHINVPIVITLHDCWLFTGHCAYFSLIDCPKWKEECKNCELSHEYPKSWRIDASTVNFKIKENLLKGSHNITIVTPSAWLGSLLPYSFLNEYPRFVINNGIDLKLFNVLPGKKKDKRIVLAVASPWNIRKGYNDLKLIADLLEGKADFVIIGLSDLQISDLPSWCKKLKKTGSISELSNWYNEASVFINPTYEDNFPTTNIEALACGTPVITYSTGGSIEAIDDETGIVVPQGDFHGMVSSALDILNGIIQIDSEDCRNRAVTLYNKEDRYLDYISLYETITRAKE